MGQINTFHFSNIGDLAGLLDTDTTDNNRELYCTSKNIGEPVSEAAMQT